MENLLIDTPQGKKLMPVYNYIDFPYPKEHETTTCRKAGKENVTYYNLTATFDIETTTICNTETPYAFMYHWQAYINGNVIFGRTYEEFTKFIDRLTITLGTNKQKRIVIYCHNLAYEFQFIKDFTGIDQIFCKDRKKPMYYVTPNGIEFRCSYFLSNMSLAKFCENSEGVTFFKLENQFNYKKLRTPSTKLTHTEKEYCYNDVAGLAQCIDYLMRDDNLATIPLTNTGYVRREYRKAMNTKENRKMFENTRLTVFQYKLLKDMFRGGNTHANRYYANTIMTDVDSYDISSSYPACIMLDYFPMTAFKTEEITSIEQLESLCKTKCVIMRVRFTNVSAKTNVAVPYIPISHAKGINLDKAVNDNGRVLQYPETFEMSLNEIDLEIINNTYDIEHMDLIECYTAERGKIPIELRQTMLQFFDAKTQLKYVAEKQYEMMKSKNRLNSTYGMMVTDPCHSEMLYSETDHTWKEIKPDIAESLDKFYKSKSNFLPYQWGIYVTSHARRRLQQMVDIVSLDLLYTDTDSIKFIGDHKAQFNAMNEQILAQCNANDIRAYSESDGIKHYLGVWDCETKKGLYKEFITLGAKKYAVRKYNGKIELTVSGLSKEKGSKELKSLEEFKIGKVFKDSGRTTSYYNESKIKQIKIKNETITTASNIGIVDTTYTLGVTDEYAKLLNIAI